MGDEEFRPYSRLSDVELVDMYEKHSPAIRLYMVCFNIGCFAILWYLARPFAYVVLGLLVLSSLVYLTSFKAIRRDELKKELQRRGAFK